MKRRKTPQRMCVGCQEISPKRQLIRIVRSPQGELSLDLSGKKSGRGAYLCRNQECFHTAVKAKRLQKALKCEISSELLAILAGELDLLEEDKEEGTIDKT